MPASDCETACVSAVLTLFFGVDFGLEAWVALVVCRLLHDRPRTCLQLVKQEDAIR